MSAAGHCRLCPAGTPRRSGRLLPSELPSPLPRWLGRGAGLLSYPLFVLGGPWEERGCVSEPVSGSAVGCPPRGPALRPGDCSVNLSYIRVLTLGVYRYLNKCPRTFELSGKSPKGGFISLWGRTCISEFPGRSPGVSRSDCCLHTELYTRLKPGRG